MVRGASGYPQFGLQWCRETPVSDNYTADDCCFFSPDIQYIAQTIGKLSLRATASNERNNSYEQLFVPNERTIVLIERKIPTKLCSWRFILFVVVIFFVPFFKNTRGTGAKCVPDNITRLEYYIRCPKTIVSRHNGGPIKSNLNPSIR